MMNLMKKINKKYHVELKNNKIVLLDKVEDPNLKNKIENFKFFSQYADFRDLKYYKNGNISSTDNVPSYDAEYKMSNTDKNVKNLEKFILLQPKSRQY